MKQRTLEPPKAKLKELCDKYKVPIHMGKLFINEIKLLDEKSCHQKEMEMIKTAKVLGLI